MPQFAVPSVLPVRRKPPVPAGAPGAHLSLAGTHYRPISLREVAQWDLQRQRMLFQILVPTHLLTRYSIDPVSLTDPQGRPLAFVQVDADAGTYRLELFHAAGAAEPMAQLELADTPFNRIEVVWVALQDPHSPRFDTDVLPSGESTLQGTGRRNLPAEAAALAAGLAPGQVRKGLGGFRWLNDRLETFMLCLNQREFTAQPLYYHTAILFEQSGFDYICGRAQMDAIARGFAAGGELQRRLDNSTPFRRPELAHTVRGRSWAIHDGILPQPWDRVQMVRRLGVHVGVNTSGEVPW